MIIFAQDDDDMPVRKYDYVRHMIPIMFGGNHDYQVCSDIATVNLSCMMCSDI